MIQSFAARRTGGQTLTEPFAVRALLIAFVFIFFGLFLFLPLWVVFSEALSAGLAAYREALVDPIAAHALKLTIIASLCAVAGNGLFGLCAAWCIARFRFPGRSVLLTLIDVPFAVSPVIAGMVLVLLFGSRGLLGPTLDSAGVSVIFALPGIILATMFVTIPFTAREIIPLLEDLGVSEEEAGLTMGATGWQVFTRITLPNIKWALFYGLILTNARAMGEFGAVSVVSGHIRGETNTLPLHVEILYNEFNSQAAFAVASLLALLALSTIAAKSFIEWKNARSA